MPTFRICFIAIFSLLIFIHKAEARTSTERPGFFSDFFAPVTTEAWGPFSKGMALTLVLLSFEDQIIDPTQAETVEDKPLGSASKYGDLAGQGIPNLLYVAGASFFGYINEDRGSYQRAKHMALASIYSGAMAQILKKYCARTPPE